VAEEPESRYFIEAAAKVLDIIESFNDYDEELSITEIARRTNLTYSSAFRLLFTLEKRGYVMRRDGRKQYLLTPSRRRFRIGYAALQTSAFHKEVTRGLAAAARRAMISLVTRINDEFDVAKALLNADRLLEEDIDLLIEYQYNDTAGQLIAAKCHQADVPTIALNSSQPGAYYFGGNNYQTGVLAGEFLSQYARKKWSGAADVCLVMSPKGLGSTQEARIAGLKDALHKGLPDLRSSAIVTAPSALSIKEGYGLTRRLLRQHAGGSHRVLIAVMTDHLGIGVEQAVREAGLEDRVVIVGQGGGRDARSLIKRGGAFQASIAFFAEAYGERVLSLALKILEGKKAPLTSFTNHVVLTVDNLKDYYPEAARRRRESQAEADSE
jgi:ribose transport system substrate-binding protein